MSTNIDPIGPGLPDEQFLRELANEYFKAPPGGAHGFPGGGALPGGLGVPPASIPASVAGSGISPSAPVYQQGNVDDIKSPPTSLPDPHFAGKGQVPASVAGSGISPSAIQYRDTKKAPATGHDRAEYDRVGQWVQPGLRHAQQGSPNALPGSSYAQPGLSHFEPGIIHS